HNSSILYKVIKKDTITSIASTFFTTPNTIIKVNNIKKHKIHVGQKLLIPIVGQNADAAVDALLNLSNTITTSTYTVKKGDTLDLIAKQYDTNISSLRVLNNLKNSKLQVGQQIKISSVGQGGYGIVNPPITFPFGYQTFWPVPYEGVTSPFGMRFHPIVHRKILHTGVDLRCDGAVVSAFAPGTVIYAGSLSGYGNIVIIDHENGYQTRYAHLASMSAEEGDTVTEGQQIGISGESGNVTGPHLHFEIRQNNIPVNPMKFFTSSLVDDETIN
ncbi:MAG: M23 family metallopeptidase, partial [Fusobacteria bacterium]|nr:M23 family metallopeptidase [Fusobacteriota bacterium]